MKENPAQLAQRSLTGLSVGDALGEQFFGPTEAMKAQIRNRELPPGPWCFTDDTIMAQALLKTLEDHGRVNQDAFVKDMAERYTTQPNRGYGGTVRGILTAVQAGGDWRDLAPAVFSGMGSLGNGAAMRVGPLGAFYHEDFSTLKREALRSAEVTHAHAEGQAGALAVAFAAAWACLNSPAKPEQGAELLQFVIEHCPESDVRGGLVRASRLPFEYRVDTAVSALGNGHRISAPDTVPFALWCVARHLDYYEEAFWTTVSGLGDRDTTCAIVGSIVALSAPPETLPELWLSRRESLDSAPH